MTTDTEALRAKFERQCRGLDLSRNEDGVYTDEFVYVAWIHYREGHAAAEAEIAAAVVAERERCVDIIESYRIPVGNSAVGEMACEWTYDALETIRDAIREGEKGEPS